MRCGKYREMFVAVDSPPMDIVHRDKASEIGDCSCAEFYVPIDLRLGKFYLAQIAIFI